MNLEILYKSKNAVVVYKPPLVPSQVDLNGDKDALTITAEMLKAEGEREELYLINRLDRVVGGLMIFARNKRAASLLSESLTSDGFIKEYFAIADGEAPAGILEDSMIKDAARSMGVIVSAENSNAKKAVLYSEILGVAEKNKKKN